MSVTTLQVMFPKNPRTAAKIKLSFLGGWWGEGGAGMGGIFLKKTLWGWDPIFNVFCVSLSKLKCHNYSKNRSFP